MRRHRIRKGANGRQPRRYPPPLLTLADIGTVERACQDFAQALRSLNLTALAERLHAIWGTARPA